MIEIPPEFRDDPRVQELLDSTLQSVIDDIVGDPGKDYRERYGFVFTDVYGNKRFRAPTRKTKWLPVELPNE